MGGAGRGDVCAANAAGMEWRGVAWGGLEWRKRRARRTRRAKRAYVLFDVEALNGMHTRVCFLPCSLTPPDYSSPRDLTR